jgi:signal transduction histidine kinase
VTASPARRWRSSLRLRLTVTGTLLAAVIFGVAAPVAISLYRASLTNAAWNTVTGTAAEVTAKLTSAQQLPDPIPMPVAPGVPRIQVLGSGNRVVTGDPASAVRPAMFRLPPGQRSERAVVAHPAFMTAGSVALYAVRTATPHGPQTVVAALSLDPAGAQARQVTLLTAGLVVVALAVVAAVSWLTAGWSLRPVERLRAQAAAIAAGGDLSARLAGQAAADRAVVPPRGRGDELAQLGGTLNAMLESLEASVDRQRRFVADAAHELRTPLAGLTTALEVARSHPGPSETLADDLLAGHRKLGRLVNDLLLLAAVDGRAAHRAEPVDLAGVVTDCSRRPAPDGVSLRLGRLDRVLVVGDEAQLSRVISNLVDNALRYAASVVELSVRRDGRHALVTVSDDGPGIPVPDRERIWERFARLDDGRSRASGGSGLGLAIVRELVTAHGGTVAVTGTQPAPGATFLVRLPAGGAEAARPRSEFSLHSKRKVAPA